MKRLLTLASVLIVLAACGDDGTGPPEPEGAVVTMVGITFLPFTTTIAVGDTVTFSFGADPHNVIFERLPGAPADILPTSNQNVMRVFTVAGTFPYDCTLHPPMAGVVVVQ